MADVVVAIPTQGRPDKLRAALESVALQSRLPKRILVVGEDSSDWAGCELAGVTFLANTRAHNLSGALNTAIANLVSEQADSESTYVAFLDDDDTWEESYLEKSLEVAQRETLDLVYAGLIRHERPTDEGVHLTIPADLSVSQFLAGNPHIQGSNMVVRLSALLRAGGFDERLASTTDRDLCIRLLDLGDLRYCAVQEHLVHHWATDYPRLSTPGSPHKAEGLQAFFEKHDPRMTNAERAAFLDRARTRFSWEPAPRPPSSKETALPIPASPSCTPKSRDPVELVIGFTATWMECATSLLKDIAEFSRALGGIARVVVCDGTSDSEALSRLIEPLVAEAIPVRLVARDTIAADAAKGKFGSYYVPKTRQRGIAFGRTALHHYLYIESCDLRHAVYWILDDDIRLDRIWLGRPAEPVAGKALLDAIREIREEYDVAVGSICGDPPVPAASLVRTQLLDLWHNLLALENPARALVAEDVNAQRTRLRRAYPDYYYDLSTRHHGHLETPFPWALPNGEMSRLDALRVLLQQAGRIASGIGVFRPVEVGHETATSGPSAIPIRGGNTLVFDRECLKTFPNIAPRLASVDLRRGDTVWCMLTARAGGLKAHHRAKRLGSVPLFVRQERRGFDPKQLTLKPVLADIFGGAFMRAFEEMLAAKLAALGSTPVPREALRLSDSDIGRTVRRFEELVSSRTVLFQMNAWRIRGLARALRRRLGAMEERHDQFGDVIREHGEPLASVLETLEKTFSPGAVADLVDHARNYPRQELEEFLRSYGENRASYARNLPVTADAHDLRAAREFLRAQLGVANPELVGEGAEGLVFSDGTLAYKYFHHGTAHFEPGQLDFLREAFSPAKGWRHLTPLERVIVQDGRVVFVRALVKGPTYGGGHLEDLRGLVRECRNQGLVLTNLAPENVVVGPDGLKYGDLGISAEPFSTASFLRMCRRAYLVYRWHFRKDLKALLTRSLHDETMPELYGFRHFLATLGEGPVEDVVDPSILESIRARKVRTMFDYGCGSGRLSRKAAGEGISVVGYDIDESAFSGREAVEGATFLGPAGLRKLLEEGRRFDLVLCNLVLCTIESDAESERVLKDLRRLVSEDGRVIVVVCNPFALGTRESETHEREVPEGDVRYRETFSYVERVKPELRPRVEVHRPLGRYIRAFRNAALEPEEIVELPATNFDSLCPCSDFMLFTLRPLRVPPPRSVSLLIKASAMEWRTIGMQVRHLVGQLEGPQRFVEKVVVTDEHMGPFVRQYAEPDWDAFVRELESLTREGVIDRHIVAPMDPATVEVTFRRWFGLSVADPRCENGQPTHTALFGIDGCRGEYVLQVDSDCLIGRHDREHDYLGDILRVFEDDPDAVTVAIPSAMRSRIPFTPEGPDGKWRTEVRCSLISRSRLLRALPLPNQIGESGRLARPWHRALDARLAATPWQSYRGGDPRMFFVHVPNDQKPDVNAWYNVLKAVEAGRLPEDQIDKVDLVGTVEYWIGRRSEDLILIVRGRNVPIPRLRRCLDSFLSQRDQSWGVVFIDAASENGMQEFLAEIISKSLGNRMTLYRNLIPAAPIENMSFAIRKVCTEPNSIVVTVDADDALIGDDVVDVVRRTHAEGADVSVGSMLATDKERRYPVTFDDPRRHRGGNVWQHLRTFRKGLFDRIPEDRLKVHGDWVPFAEDWAFMLPIVELARRPTRIARPVYFYEPSADKLARSREEREVLIAKIVAMRPLTGGA